MLRGEAGVFSFREFNIHFVTFAHFTKRVKTKMHYAYMYIFLITQLSSISLILAKINNNNI